MPRNRSATVACRRAVALIAVVTSMAIGGTARAGGGAPPNDDFANADTVTEPLPFTASQDTTGASEEPDEPSLHDFGCGFSGATVWYSFTPSAETVVAADTIGSDFDTVLAVWTGSALGSLTLVGCADDSRGGVQSSVPFLAEAGTEYHIQVGGFVGETGALSFRVRETTAGFVDGTVTHTDTAAPLSGICVAVIDAVFNGGNLSVTAADGTYRVAVRPGEYIVGFFDCQRDAFVVEFWDDVSTDAAATEIVVSADAVTPGIDAGLAPACPGFGTSGLDQIVGTPGGETLTGTAEPEALCGFGGDDILRGGNGGDYLLGGPGADRLNGNDGRDNLDGGRGPDILIGGAGRDFLFGGADRDECHGGPDRDRAASCEVRDRI